MHYWKYIYIPPPFSIEVVKTLASFLSQHPGIPTIIVGDFNNYLDAELDKMTAKIPLGGVRGGQTSFARPKGIVPHRINHELIGHSGFFLY